MKNNLFSYNILLLSTIIGLSFPPTSTAATEEKILFHGRHPVNPLDPNEKVNPVNTPSSNRGSEINQRSIPTIKKHIKPFNAQKLPNQKKRRSFLKKKKFNSKFPCKSLNKEIIPNYVLNNSLDNPPPIIIATSFGQVLSALSGTLIFGIKKNKNGNLN